MEFSFMPNEPGSVWTVTGSPALVHRPGLCLPWQAVFMTDGRPEPAPIEKVTAAMDDFMATVLRHLRTGQGDPLEDLGLEKAKAELQHWQPDIPGAEPAGGSKHPR
jgi:hypothetical protein